MNIVDGILFGVLALSILWGFKAGSIRAVGNVVGTILSAILAWKFLEPTVNFLAPWFGSSILRQVVFYLILFAIISKLMGLVIYFIEKLFGMVSWLPFAEGANKLIGAIVGAIEGIIICTFGILTVAYFAQYVVLNLGTLEALKTSRLATPIVSASPVLFFLLPKEVNFKIMPQPQTEENTEPLTEEVQAPAE